MNWRHLPFTPCFRQFAVSFSIDSSVGILPESFPTQITIDVDGIEARILIGVRDTLLDSRVKIGSR